MLNFKSKNYFQSSRKGRILPSLIVGFGLALTISLSIPANTARAEKVDLTVVHETEISARALKNTVRSFGVPDHFCSETDRERRTDQLKELEDFQKAFEDRIADAVQWSRNLRGTPFSAHYQHEQDKVERLRSSLTMIGIEIRNKISALKGRPLKDCGGLTKTSVLAANAAGNETPKGPLDGITFFEPIYYDASAPVAPSRICSEKQKQSYVIAVASARANAGFNVNQADGVVQTLKEIIRTTDSDATRSAVQEMLSVAENELEGALKELGELDELYEKAQSLAVVDCTDQMETAMIDPLEQSELTDLGTEIYRPQLQDLQTIELPASVCNRFERDQLVGKVSALFNRALNNGWEWMKRRTSIQDALRQGEGHEELLLKAKIEADGEVQKWETIQDSLTIQEQDAASIPIVDCKTPKDSRTSMSSGSPQSRLLAAIQNSMAQTPYQASGGVALPDPYADDDLALEADYALRDRQDDLEYMERYLEEQKRLEENRAEGKAHIDRLHAARGLGKPKAGMSKDGVEEIIPTAARRQPDNREVPVTQGSLERVQNRPTVKDILDGRGNNTRVNQPDSEKPKVRTGPKLTPMPIETPSVNTGALTPAASQNTKQGGGMKQIAPPPMVFQQGTQAKGAGSAAGNPDLF